MSAFGDQLKKAREARGLPLEAVARATRIVPRHLDALERGDIQALPAGPFGKGYVTAYAQFLGIDPQPILEAYRSEEQERGLGTPESQRKTMEELSRIVLRRPDVRRRRAVAWMRSVPAAALLLGLVLAALWLWNRSAEPERRDAPAARPPPIAAAREIPPAPEPSVAEPAAEDGFEVPADGLEVTHYGVGTEVVERRLVGRATEFPEGTRVSFWTRILGGEPGGTVRHLWFHEGRAVMRADLEIGGSHWRTHSRLVLPPGATGRWRVEARSPEGRILARQEFLCLPREEQETTPPRDSSAPPGALPPPPKARNYGAAL